MEDGQIKGEKLDCYGGIMVEYIPGDTVFKDKKEFSSILDIKFNDNLFIYVFPGRKSENDIWVKFRDFSIPRTRIRTPKHIHWTVDLLIKRDKEGTLSSQFFRSMLDRWESVKPLPDREYDTVLNNLVQSRNKKFLDKYTRLNKYGFFSIVFLTHLMELLMIQEKTNDPDAYMFKGAVNALLSSDDLYSIITKAGFTGR